MRAFDWVGHWFTLLDETGEQSKILFGRIPEGSIQAELALLPHAQYDGASGLVHLLRKQGALTQECLPRLPERSRPSLLVRLREAFKIALRSPVRGRKWRYQNPAWKLGASSSDTIAVSWQVFSMEETQKALSRARMHGVSLNSLLLKCLCDAVEPMLEPSQLPSVWLMPVALHPEITLNLEPRNQSSYMDVFLPSGASLQEVEARVRREEKNGAFWGAWLLLNLGRVAGEGLIRALVKSNPKNQQKTGVFSNLGNWSGPEPQGPADAWFFIPPVVEFQPFAASALTWNHRLSIAVRLHPALSVDRGFSERIVGLWKLGILGD